MEQGVAQDRAHGWRIHVSMELEDAVSRCGGIRSIGVRLMS
jgi:hypothetical protein